MLEKELINISMKVNKYDRQIRLWGPEGQRRLGEARVALLGCSGAGIEALKNLVLPGVGFIDIYDDQILTLADLHKSFFFAPEDVGKARAQAASANLLEMNPDVKGEAIVAKPCSLLQQKEKLKSYDLIIASDLLLSEQAEVSRVCWDEGVAVVFIAVVGFFLYVRNQRKVHVIEFERTAAKKYYLRLDNPFPALQKHSEQWNISSLMKQLEKADNDKDKKTVLGQLEHIPYPIILMQACQILP
jgi:NEDD8-activating enzyme E1 regulatory subunit